MKITEGNRKDAKSSVCSSKTLVKVLKTRLNFDLNDFTYVPWYILNSMKDFCDVGLLLCFF